MKLFKYIPVFCLIVCLFAPVGANAQAFMEPFSKDLPVYEDEFVPEESFSQQTHFYKEKPFGDKSLGYEIRLPHSWKPAEQLDSTAQNISNKVLGDIARYNSEARLEERSRIVIQVSELEHQMSALHWFMQYAISKGITLEGIKEFSYSHIQALHVIIEKDISYAVRTIAWISGNRMMFVKFYTPFDVWKDERVLQSQIMNSFKLTSPAPAEIEPLKPFYFLDIGQFKYPKSWGLNSPKFRSIDEMKASVINYSDVGELDGKIDVKLISAYSEISLEEAIEQTKEDLKLLKESIKESHKQIEVLFNRFF